jgi:hypothetical protein
MGGLASARTFRCTLHVTGILAFRHPIAAAFALTQLFSALLLGMGSFRLLASIWHRLPHRGWLGLSGAISIVLGLLLWNAWPASGLWFIGFCVGIDLIVEGAGWNSLCLSRNQLGALAPKLRRRVNAFKLARVRRGLGISIVAARSSEPQQAPALGRAAYALSVRKDDAEPNQSAR